MLRTRRRAAHGDRPIRPHWHAMPCPTRSLQRSPWRQRQTGRGIHRGHAFLRSTTPPPACTPAASNVCPSPAYCNSFAIAYRWSVLPTLSAWISRSSCAPTGIGSPPLAEWSGRSSPRPATISPRRRSRAGCMLSIRRSTAPRCTGPSRSSPNSDSYGIPLRGCIDVGALPRRRRHPPRVL